MRKKALLVIRWPVGGIRTFIRYVYREFDPARWQLTILAPALQELQLLKDDLAQIHVRFIPVEEDPHPTAFFAKVASVLMRDKYDLVHSHGFTSGMGASLPAWLRGIPHLMTSHETLNATQFAGLKGWALHNFMGVLFRLIDTVHSVSHDAQRNLLEFFPSLSRKEGSCVVIPNGIEVERFIQAEPRNLRQELGLGAGVFLIGFLGRFMSPKGFRFLVGAMELLRECNGLLKRPLVLTFGEGGFIREERIAIQEKGLQNFFKFMPFTSNVAETIRGLDVIVMPSIWEACGLLAMEVLVCGKPLIGTDCIGLREVLNGTPAFIVPSANAVALAETILHVMETDSRESFLGYRAAASERYDVRRTRESILNLYDTMTRRR